MKKEQETLKKDPAEFLKESNSPSRNEKKKVTIKIKNSFIN